MKILVASGGSHDESADPVAAAASFPWPAGSEFHVLTVAEVIQAAVVAVAPDVPAMLDVPDVQEGDPETTVTDYAKSWGADLIVVGSRDRSGVQRLLTGSVSQIIVKHSPCSVLVVKHCVR